MHRFKTISILFILLFFCSEKNHWQYSREPFELGPVKPSVDLRNMPRQHIVRHSCELLETGAERRIQAFKNGSWQAWRDTVRERVVAQMGAMPFGEKGAPLNIRFVSKFELPHCDVENVLFESLPGWDVNASVFLPKKEKYLPPWKAIVVPVGHSSKTRNNYQIPAQVFASLGYVAVIFDPPGMAGEKQGGNDHFTDGVRCYLTGASSNRYFIMDAIRCIDYLSTRSDIDMSKGVGMTGVSGGGTTTMFATLIDDRIRASGPACCALPSAYHPVLNVYAPCAETMIPNRYADGLDNVDLLCAAIPIPLLFMFGEKDEVFQAKWSYQIAEDIQNAYHQNEFADRFEFYADPGGHAYTVEMALRFTKWMDRWITEQPERELPALSEADFPILEPERLFCYPNLEGNMFSLNAKIAVNLAETRKTEDLKSAIQTIAHIKNSNLIPDAQTNKASQIWVHNLQEILLKPDPGIELPATFMYPIENSTKRGAILFFDDRGRWTELRTQNYLAEACNFLKRDAQLASVLSVDLRGWGDTVPADMPYDVASWAHRERWVSFVSAAMGDHIMAMRIRDGLAALAYLRTRSEIDASKIVAGGHGLGAIVALHVAAFNSALAGLFCVDGLATFESLACSETYDWSVESFLPHALKYYDLPELVASINIPTLMVSPLDANKKSLSEEEIKQIYGDAIQNNPDFRFSAEKDLNEIIKFIQKLILDEN